MMKKWNIRQPDEVCQKNLSKALDITPTLAQLLINRGLDDAEGAGTFLNGTLSELYNPFLMEGMHEAVSRLKKAIENKGRIFIHGDYDVDGVTAVSLLVCILRKFGIEPYYYIPDRLSEGYGLGEGGVREAIKIGADLVITVDCGISSYEEVESLNAHNIDVIITDHHEVPRVLPRACSIINPLQKKCPYPDKNLSGVSIAFKLCEALCTEFNNKDVWRYLDLVSLGTISDVAPLVGENRILVKEGLRVLKNSGSTIGIHALIEASSLRKTSLGSFELGYILGPRINAAGRLGSAITAVKLLLTQDSEEAKVLAKRLTEVNRERQRIESSILKEALSKIERDINFKEHRVIVLNGEDWHTGVIGIVASRISDRFYRPCILVSTKDGVGRGSGRSIGDFHLFKALSACEDVLKEFGGHRYACGLTVLEENLTRFKKIINEVASELISSTDLVPQLDIDMEMVLDSLDYRVVEDILKLEPFGEGNPYPIFCSRNLHLVRPPRIVKGEHIKLWVTDGVKNFEAIAFGVAKDSNIESIFNRYPEFDLAYTVSINTWQGIDSIQLKIEDIRPSIFSQP